MAVVAHKQVSKGRRLDNEVISKGINESLGGVSVENSYKYK